MCDEAPGVAIVGLHVDNRLEKSAMKTAILMFCAVFVSAPAFAINQYNINTMSCSQVQSTLKRDGQAQLHYSSPGNPSMTLYDSYVRDSSYCNSRATRATNVPTKDTGKCKVHQCKKRAGR